MKQKTPFEDGNYYHKFSTFLKNRFGERVQKITINADFTCPNRDGQAGEGGCIYCNNLGFNVNVRRKPASIKEQIESGITHGHARKIKRFMAYFQPFSNTYDTVANLKTRYDEILPFPEIVGLAIGTRPDCVDEEKLALIDGYTKKHMVWIEYGLQTIHDRTLALINRGHDYLAFKNAIALTNVHAKILICVHMILGLPGETHDDMLASARALAELPIHGIKLHPLHIVKNTVLEEQHKEHKYVPLSFDQYIKVSCDFLELLPPHIIVQRLTGDAPEDLLIGPAWVKRKMAILNAIDNEFRRRGTYQGTKYLRT
ncbi:MAG: TIGR01212 family radical SAM protein [Candidatus Omnitrophica bacterium]|nr:TIGR01212 family radical SAM protein [Candidatus Omnitrophota bacterium]